MQHAEPQGNRSLLTKLRQCWSTSHLSREEKKMQTTQRIFSVLGSITMTAMLAFIIYTLESGSTTSVTRISIFALSKSFVIDVIIPILMIVRTPNMKRFVIKGLTKQMERVSVPTNLLNLLTKYSPKCCSNNVHPAPENIEMF